VVISTTGLKGISRFDPAYRQAGPIFSTKVVISTTGLKGISRFDPAYRQAGPIFSTITLESFGQAGRGHRGGKRIKKAVKTNGFN